MIRKGRSLLLNSKRWWAILIAGTIFIFSVIINFASMAFSTNFSKLWGDAFEEWSEKTIEEGSVTKKIAIIDLDGVIQDNGDVTSIWSSGGYNHKLFMEQLNHAKDDNATKAIILRVNTPGGGVVESAEIHRKIVQIQEETKKPVYVSMGGIAASGGYYVSAPADKIFASPETMTGSLGVIMQGTNYGELAKKLGVDFVTIKSGEYKDIMSQTREMTEAERNIMKSMLDNSFNGFVKVIAEGRNMPEERVREIADGRIYDGRQAKELDLIDDFGYLEEVIEAIRADYSLDGASVVRYGAYSGFPSLFGTAMQKITGKEGEMFGAFKMLTQPNSPRLMYLYAE